MPGAIVAFGDSYTAGVGARPDESFPALLAARLGRPVENEGVPGETAAEALDRLVDALDPPPELVIVEFGANEAYRGHTVESCLLHLESIVRACHVIGARVVLVGIHFGHFHETFDEGLRGIAARNPPCGLVLDVLRGIVPDQRGHVGDRALLSDQHHPNAAGYAIMAERILPEVKRMLADG